MSSYLKKTTSENKSPSYKSPFNSSSNNNIYSGNYINYNFSNIKQKLTLTNNSYSFQNEKPEIFKEKKLEDIKSLNIKNDIESIYDLTYKTYKKEFQKDN